MKETVSELFVEVFHKNGVSSHTKPPTKDQIEKHKVLREKILNARKALTEAKETLRVLEAQCDCKVLIDEWGLIYTIRRCATCDSSIDFI